MESTSAIHVRLTPEEPKVGEVGLGEFDKQEYVRYRRALRRTHGAKARGP